MAWSFYTNVTYFFAKKLENS